MDEDIQHRIREIISEIEEKSASGDCIYRGEPETHEGHPYYGKVSSSLWREYGLEIEAFDIEAIQTEMLDGVKMHVRQLPQDFRADLDASNFEVLTEIQHYGGKTNLIDFTTDYFIALFFACDGHHDDPGRVILQKTEDINDMIDLPRNPQHRVIAQKSVFVRPPKGFIEPHENNIVTIPGHLKRWILQNLRKYHGISTETIYNDLHGFIRHQDIHGGAYTEFYRGFTSVNRGNEAITPKEKQKWYEAAVKHYTRSIQLDPNHATTYHNCSIAQNNLGDHNSAIDNCNRAIAIKPDYAEAYNIRGVAYMRQVNYDRAIEDFNRAIELNYVLAYYNRGEALLYLGEWERAKSDLTTAEEKGVNIINKFGTSVANFQSSTGITLPPDIAAMLTPTQS